MSLKDIAYTPRQESVAVVFDDDLRRLLTDAEEALAAQKREEQRDGQGLSSKVPELEAVVDAHRRAHDEAAVTFTFRALGRRRLADLMKDTPPTKEQMERWRERVRQSPLTAGGQPEFDYEKFAPILIAEALVTPETTLAEVSEMWDDPDGWSDAIWLELWSTAWRVNQEVSTRPTFGTGSS